MDALGDVYSHARGVLDRLNPDRWAPTVPQHQRHARLNVQHNTYALPIRSLSLSTFIAVIPQRQFDVDTIRHAQRAAHTDRALPSLLRTKFMYRVRHKKTTP